MTPFRSIIIVGGGTAGWLAAAYLQRVLGSNPGHPLSITLIESPEIGTIGVGEATLPTIRTMLRVIDIPETRLFSEVHATLKNGIRFVGWRQGGDMATDRYDHPFDSPVLMDGYSTIVHWLNLKQRGLTDQPFADAGVVQTALFDGLKSPKFMDSQPYDAAVPYAYHLDAIKLAGMLRRVSVERGVTHVEGRVVEVQRSDAGISALRLEDGRVLSADFFIDCTGFAGLLIGEVLEVPWKSFSPWLLCDRAVAGPVEYETENAPIRSFTTATAQGSGWTWEIDLDNRRGTGYVYSSAHCSDDEAVATLHKLQAGAKQVAEPRMLKMRIGHRSRTWERNCLAIGMAGGFLEPLESTGIYLIELALSMFVDHLPSSRESARSQEQYNLLMNDLFDELRDFVMIHYTLSARRDTPFWRDFTEGVKLPDGLEYLMNLWREKVPHATDLQRKVSLFGPANYFFIMAGLRHLPERGIGQAPYLAPDVSKRVLDTVAEIRRMANHRSPDMRDYVRKVSSALRHAPQQ